MKRGKLIVIEGNDGSGKATQVVLLHKYLKTKKIPVKVIDFPRYNDSFFGKFISRFLQGEFGKLEEVNPYLISIVYAQDREEARGEMEDWLSKGNIVLANRYVPSNLAHQSGRLPKSKREAFIQWDSELEYKINKLPKEDMIIYLHVPYKASIKLLAVKKQKKDIAEKNIAYLRSSEESYNNLSQTFSHWEKIECVDNKGNIYSKEEIHTDIKKLLAKRGILQ
jgi:dTMP kinase